MEKIINSHNKKILNNWHNKNITRTNKNMCSCRKKEKCMLNNRCLESEIVYKAEIYTRDDKKDSKIYIGIAGTKFKDRLGNHNFSFNHKEAANNTTLAKELWKIRNDKKIEPKISWTILKKASICNGLNNRCNLCLNEKLFILKYSNKYKERLLNDRNELATRCIHRQKFSLADTNKK